MPGEDLLDVRAASFGELGEDAYLLAFVDAENHEYVFELDEEQMLALRDGVSDLVGRREGGY